MTDQTNDCFICGAPCQVVIELPNLPLTDTYGTFGRRPGQVPASGFDQQLLSCARCGHGQLGKVVPPDVLYTTEYSFRTSTSQTASAGTDFFLAFLKQVAGSRHFRCALDVGCNDLHLLVRLKGSARQRVGIDPIWAGREDERPYPDIAVSGAMVEDAALVSLLPEPPDLIVARHTMEHIHHPVELIRRLLAHAAEDAIIVIEVPNFDTLVRRQRYDQVFHQHIQYYSRSSLMRLLQESGGELIAMTENYHHWGATLMAFRRVGPGPGVTMNPEPTIAHITEQYRRFQREITDLVPFVQSLSGPIYGYGAAQMLPVLGYHLKTDFSFLDVILDDDPSKDGLGYWNLPVKIARTATGMNLSDATVLITAVDNTAPILRRLLEQRPKHIVLPFRLI